MYRIWHRIIKPVLITEEGGEKPACYPLMGTDVCTHKGTLMQKVKNVCCLPMGVKLALRCTIHIQYTEQRLVLLNDLC